MKRSLYFLMCFMFCLISSGQTKVSAGLTCHLLGYSKEALMALKMTRQELHSSVCFDVNKNGVVDLNDAQTILKVATGSLPLIILLEESDQQDEQMADSQGIIFPTAAKQVKSDPIVINNKLARKEQPQNDLKVKQNQSQNEKYSNSIQTENVISENEEISNPISKVVPDTREKAENKTENEILNQTNQDNVTRDRSRLKINSNFKEKRHPVSKYVWKVTKTHEGCRLPNSACNAPINEVFEMEAVLSDINFLFLRMSDELSTAYVGLLREQKFQFGTDAKAGNPIEGTLQFNENYNALNGEWKDEKGHKGKMEGTQIIDENYNKY